MKNEEYLKKLNEVKERKIKELKQKREGYKKTMNFSFFNFLNLILEIKKDKYNDLENQKMFLRNLIYKYDSFKKQIHDSKTIEEVELIDICFSELLRKNKNNN